MLLLCCSFWVVFVFLLWLWYGWLVYCCGCDVVRVFAFGVLSCVGCCVFVVVCVFFLFMFWFGFGCYGMLCFVVLFCLLSCCVVMLVERTFILFVCL